MRIFASAVAAVLSLASCGDPVPRLPGKTPAEQVLWAAKYEDVRALRTVLRLGADPNTRDPNNAWTPVIWASVRGCSECIRLLADQGADLEARGRMRQTALILSVRWGQEDSARMLLERGADLEGRDPNGWSALLWGAYLGRERMVRDFLERGALPDAAAADGLTPLMAAARRGRAEVVELLLGRGAAPVRRGPRRMTAADFAAAGGYKELAARLRAGR